MQHDQGDIDTFIGYLSRAIREVYLGAYPTYLTNEINPDTIARAFYDYPDVAARLPLYDEVVTKALDMWSREYHYPYTMAPSRPGQVQLDELADTYLDKVRYPLSYLEEMYSAIKETGQLPESWINDVPTDPEERPGSIAVLIARKELGFYIGEETRKDFIERVSGIVRGNATAYLDELVRLGIISSYPKLYQVEALADVIIGYRDKIPRDILAIFEPHRVRPPQLRLVPLAKPPAPSYTPRPPASVTPQTQQFAYNFLSSLPASTIKEMAASLGMRPKKSKDETVTEIIESLPYIPRGTLTPRLREVYDILTNAVNPTTEVEELEELPIQQLRQLYVTETQRTTPATRQQMVQEVTEAESSRVTSTPASSYATTMTDPLQPWREALQYYPPSEVVASLGMVVPPDHEDRDYIERNLVAYSPVIVDHYTQPLTPEQVAHMPNLADVLSHYTDQELFSMLGVYVPYYNRQQLITRLASAAVTPTFFMPLVPRCANGNRNISIAFGTISSYECLSPEELLSFYHNGVLDIGGYRFTPQQLNELRELARVVPEYSSVYRALIR
jgi:hypothetical protein